MVLLYKTEVVGPNVSIGDKTKITGSISQTIIQKSSTINNAAITNSMIGSSCVYTGKADDLSMGDFSTQV